MLSRRRMLAGLGAAAVVVGFDPVGRTWVAEAEAKPKPGHPPGKPSPFDCLPDLDGMVTTDPATTASYGTDAGSIVHNAPIAVLFPGSVQDIQKMVRFCRRHKIKVACRGQGHTTFGQSQVAGGLVIDMGALNQIHSITPAGAEVDAGVTWKDLTLATTAVGYTPPVLTGYTNLSIGGTLSVGGMSGAFNAGAQVDHVQELEVVTGTGDIKRCSRHRHRDLFDACLAGLGQCGIITRAVLDLVPAKTQARTFLLHYTDNAQFFVDFRKLLNRGEMDRAFTLLFPDGAGGWIYQVNGIKFYNAGDEPDADFLLRDLSVPVAAATVSDSTYLEHILAVDVVIDFFKAVGLWDGVLHPWFDIFMPDSTIEGYVQDVVPTLTPEDVGPTGFMLIFGLRRSAFKQKLFRLPPSQEWVWLFDVLTAAPTPGPNPVFKQQMLSRNRVLFEQGRMAGGTRYPIGALEFSQTDWAIHYSEVWSEFKQWKRRFDPDRILAPGSGIF
jgi:cytokinin dehydrogenase